jgi:hypothetical protein
LIWCFRTDTERVPYLRLEEVKRFHDSTFNKFAKTKCISPDTNFGIIASN